MTYRLVVTDFEVNAGKVNFDCCFRSLLLGVLAKVSKEKNVGISTAAVNVFSSNNVGTEMGGVNADVLLIDFISFWLLAEIPSIHRSGSFYVDVLYFDFVLHLLYVPYYVRYLKYVCDVCGKFRFNGWFQMVLTDRRYHAIVGGNMVQKYCVVCMNICQNSTMNILRNMKQDF